MFYSPNDIAYKTSKKFAAQVPLYIVKGLYYPKKIVAGIKHAKHSGLDPRKNWLAAILVATLKANGSGFIKPMARYISITATLSLWFNDHIIFSCGMVKIR